MQTVVKFEPREDGRSISHYRRESSFRREFALIDLGEARDALIARFYGRGSVAYCVVWILGYNYGLPSARGYGKAGGWGYHKDSAALQEALASAGVTLGYDIDGHGDEAMHRAIKAIGDHMGIKRSLVHLAHA
jgi:hypothetical protein